MVVYMDPLGGKEGRDLSSRVWGSFKGSCRDRVKGFRVGFYRIEG